MNRKTIVALVLITAFVSGLGVAYGAYLMQSNNLSHTSATQAVITLTQNSTISIVGLDTVRLTATESSLTGQTVTFFDGATQIGTAVSSAGSATFDYPIATAKTFDFHATATHP